MSLVPLNIEEYCINHSTRISDHARNLMDHTRAHIHGSQMLIGEMEASLFTFLIQFGRIKKILELGTYTGFSSLVMAEALPHDGEIITIDINPHTTEIAKKYWAESPHGHKIKSILKPGPEALNEIHEKFDMIFIDADKNNYPYYLKWATDHLNERGIIITDNTLWYGKVLQAGLDKQTDSIRKHNQDAFELDGFSKTLLPIRDGIFLLTRNSN
jgi:caffeoyl-CoA O-methyltransferase